MRGRLWKKVSVNFKKQLEQRFPQFVFDDKDGQYWIWRWQVAANLHLCVALQGFDRRDQFVIEVAWNRSREFLWSHGADDCHVLIKVVTVGNGIIRSFGMRVRVIKRYSECFKRQVVDELESGRFDSITQETETGA